MFRLRVRDVTRLSRATFRALSLHIVTRGNMAFHALQAARETLIFPLKKSRTAIFSRVYEKSESMLYPRHDISCVPISVTEILWDFLIIDENCTKLLKTFENRLGDFRNFLELLLETMAFHVQ